LKNGKKTNVILMTDLWWCNLNDVI